MSNHSGSYMLNDVIKLLEREKVFETLGREKTQRLVSDIVKMSRNYDCNAGEILHGVGERLGLCYYCLNAATDLEDGLCPDCREE